VLEWITRKRPTALGIISGAVAGLVAITPAAGYVGPMAAMGIGALASLVCYVAVVVVKSRYSYDDSLDAFGVHGVGGMVGALLTGFWATTAVNPAGFDGVFHGGGTLLLKQLAAVAVCAAYSFAVSWVLLKVIDKTMGLRVCADKENIGLDLTQHSESAYTLVG
jgi:Amt family ammonium transporter